jgi:hypothetical protein
VTLNVKLVLKHHLIVPLVILLLFIISLTILFLLVPSHVLLLFTLIKLVISVNLVTLNALFVMVLLLTSALNVKIHLFFKKKSKLVFKLAMKDNLVTPLLNYAKNVHLYAKPVLLMPPHVLHAFLVLS